MTKKHEEYDWLNDPFDEKKNAQTDQTNMSKKGRLMVSIGCLAIVLCLVVLIVTFVVFSASMVASFGSDLSI